MNTRFIVAGFFVFSAAVFAGDLEVLPNTEESFREKIEAFIKPGSSLKDSVTLLEAYRFKCEKLKKQKNTTWCHRSDGSALASVVRDYEVVLETNGAQITHVKTSTRLVGL